MMANDEILAEVWENVMKAIHAYNNTYPLPSPIIVRNTINNSDTSLAKEIILKYTF